MWLEQMKKQSSKQTGAADAAPQNLKTHQLTETQNRSSAAVPTAGHTRSKNNGNGTDAKQHWLKVACRVSSPLVTPVAPPTV